jgi:diguanylate cyclase (GGDEF)-like protein
MGPAFSGDGPDLAALQRMLADGSAGLHRALLRDLRGTAFFVFDRYERFVFAEGAEIWRAGLDPERDVEGRTIAEAFPVDYPRMAGPVADVLAGVGGDIEVPMRDGIAWLHTAPILDAAGTVVGGLGITVDVTARRRAETALRVRMGQQSAVAALGRRALEGVSVSRLLEEAATMVAERLDVDRVSILSYDEDSGLIALRAGVGWSKELVRRTVVPLTDDMRRSAAALAAGPRIVDDMSMSAPLGDFLVEQGVKSLMTVLIGRGEHPFGTLSALTLSPRAFSAEDADFLQAVANVLWDAIERYEADAANEHAALHDALTDLPNRRLLIGRLQQALARARGTRAAVAVLLLDLDNFKVINDSLGHGGGDELLRALTPRLRAAARECDTIARLGGDEFVLVCDGVLSEEHAMELAQRVVRAFETPFVIGGRHHVIKSSIGVVIDDGHSTPEGLLRDADTAMYRAKENGRGRCEVFSPVMRVRAIARLRTESELQGAAERGELRVHYQPLFEITDRRLVGMEALVRWERPDHGLMPPDEFIPVAEETGLIVGLGEWVLTAAAAQLAQWQAELGGAEQLGIAINVSGRQLLTPGFDETVGSALARTGLPGDRLSLEVTESMLMEQTDTPLSVLAKLRRMGVRVVLDDFGTGYSSLSRLKDFPLDALKIDRSFIDRLGDDPDREPIVVAIIAMARALGLEVIAEGVETERALVRLTALQCEIAQGFLLSRPIPPEQMAELLRRELAGRPRGNVVPLRRAPGA